MRKSLSLLLFFLAAQLFLGCSLDPKKDNPPANSYDVTFSKNDAAASGTMSPQSIASGSSAKLTANAFTKPGWAFTGWATTAGGAIAYVDGASYTMVNADVTLFATWAANGYTITFDKNDVDASGAMPPQTIASGSSAKLTANSFTRPGWVFTGWATTAGGMVAYVDGASYTMGNGDVALFATWTANGYTISFDKNDSGAGGTMPSQTIASGSSAKLTANAYVKSGWAFAGWATTAGGPAAYGDGATYTMGSADVTLFATWSANGCTITFDKNDSGATGTMPPQTIASGSSANLTANAFTKPGWAFAGWATTADGAVEHGDGASYKMGTSSVTLFAKWTANNYTITFDKNDSMASGTMSPQSIASGSSANLTANAFTRPGWRFRGWAATPGGVVAYADRASYTMGTSSVTLYAQWENLLFGITFDKNDAAASGEMPGQSIPSGLSANLMLNAFTKPGFAFAGWATTADGPVSYSDGARYTMGTSSVTLYAKWIPNFYFITFDKNDLNASGTMSRQAFNSGLSGNLTLNAFTKPGAVFAGWATTADGLVAYADGALYTMGISDVILYARWTAAYTITFDKNDAGASGTMLPQTIASGVSAKLTADAFVKSGSAFAGWALSASGSVSYTDGAIFTMGTSSVTLYARWIQLPIATTSAATLVLSTTATLNGNAVPNGLATTAWFRCSTTNPGTGDDGSGTRTPSTGGSSVGSGSASVAYSQPITGLAPGTTYYFWAIASSTAGKTFGAILSFTTSPALPTVTTSVATGVTNTTAILNGLCNPNGSSTTCWFRYSTVSPGSGNDTFGTRTPPTGGTVVGSGSAPVAYYQTITGLVPGTTYYFCAIGQSSLGNAFGALFSFKTLP